MTFKTALLSLALFIGACGQASETPMSLEPATELPVTSAITLPEKGVAYAFVPNDVAQWLSQLIILSEDGDLYQATTNSREALPIEAPKTKSILGLNRPKAPGMFLAITESGDLNAYVETSDDGQYGPAPQTISNLQLSHFCTQPSTPIDQFHARNISGKISAYSINVTESEIKILPLNVDDQSGLPKDCNGTAMIADTDDEIFLSVTTNQPNISFTRSNTPKIVNALVITSGITIPGVENPQSVYSVSENFGGPFNNGLVLVSDADAPRFVIISADLARNTLR